MSIPRLIATGVLALGLMVGGARAGLAEGAHSHGNANTHIELILNKGAKWETDAALRDGMTRIRNDMAASLPRIHDGGFASTEYVNLANKIDGHITYLVENCKLAPEADEQLHVVLAEVMDGAAAMKSDTGQHDGAVKIVRALELYPKYFDHADWKPLGG